MRLAAALFGFALLACGEQAPAALPAAQYVDTSVGMVPAPLPLTQNPEQRAQLTDSITVSRQSAIAVAAARIAPSVVSVNVTRRARQRPRSAWDWFWAPRGFEREVQGLGSGFVVSPNGVIVTNQHVTEGATEIVVTMRDGTDYEATLLGEDPFTDIAVLKIDAGQLPAVRIGRSTDLMIGEWVVAIGNPYGYLLGNTEPSVTAGVVSAVGRNIIPSGNDETVYLGMIQTDAAINQGNSGGPLANALGEVIGVNSSIFSESGGSLGIGFAIPIERALRVAAELERHGRVRRSWVGLSVVGPDRMRDWKRVGGLAVSEVAEDGAAANAGIRTGDVLVSAAGRPLRTYLDWEAVKLDVAPDEALDLVVQRGESERRVRVIVGDLPTTRAERVAALGGMELITITPAIRQERRIRSETGALIYHLLEETQRNTGLREGDVIIQINRTRITRAQDVQEAFREAAGHGVVSVYVERGGGRGWMEFYIR